MGLAGEAAPPLWRTVGLAIGAVAIVFLAGKFLINPVFRLLARYGGREVMTAAALLVVVGAAWLMDLGGLSMAMGAFLAGVLMSESTFRHQLEADVEPFRAILLGLFFLSVGMSLDLGVVLADWRVVVGGVIAFMAVKAVAIYGVARVFKATEREAVERAVLFAQGGEFAFVLYAAALTTGVFDARISGVATAVVILSMALTPLTALIVGRLMPASTLNPEDADGVDKARNLRERVLIIGFGRFAQVVSQPAGPRRGRVDHRPGRGDDPGRRQFRLQGLLWRRHPAGRAARLRG
jgi:glutathione-regulated potassium-efflux system protein KefB